MATNKVVLANGETLIDLSNDSVTPATMTAGTTAHNAAGEVIEGSWALAEAYIGSVEDAPKSAMVVIDPNGKADTDVMSQKELTYAVNQLSEEIVDLKGGLTLGIASDGLIYLFVDGAPVGTGIPQGQSGDVYGYIDENNHIVLKGVNKGGEYTFDFVMDDGSTIYGGAFEYDVVEIINQIPISTDTDGTVFNTTGYMEKRRLGSSYTVSTLSNANASNPTFVTGFIPVKEGDVIRLKNCYIDSNTISSNTTYGADTGSFRIGIYNASKAKVGAQDNSWVRMGTGVSSPSPYFNSFVTDSNGFTTQFTVTKGTGLDISFIRLTLASKDGYTPSDAIVTVNQEIK